MVEGRKPFPTDPMKLRKLYCPQLAAYKLGIDDFPSQWWIPLQEKTWSKIHWKDVIYRPFWWKRDGTWIGCQLSHSGHRTHELLSETKTSSTGDEGWTKHRNSSVMIWPNLASRDNTLVSCGHATTKEWEEISVQLTLSPTLEYWCDGLIEVGTINPEDDVLQE